MMEFVDTVGPWKCSSYIREDQPYDEKIIALMIHAVDNGADIPLYSDDTPPYPPMSDHNDVGPVEAEV
jgi:hypothetical protein